MHLSIYVTAIGNLGSGQQDYIGCIIFIKHNLEAAKTPSDLLHVSNICQMRGVLISQISSLSVSARLISTSEVHFGYGYTLFIIQFTTLLLLSLVNEIFYCGQQSLVHLSTREPLFRIFFLHSHLKEKKNQINNCSKSIFSRPTIRISFPLDYLPAYRSKSGLIAGAGSPVGKKEIYPLFKLQLLKGERGHSYSHPVLKQTNGDITMFLQLTIISTSFNP